MSDELITADERMKWYVVTTFSNFEESVKKALLEQIRNHKQEGLFDEIWVPKESPADGKQKKGGREMPRFPGYIFVRMVLNDETWHTVRNTPRVTGFLGGKQPQPLSDVQVAKIRDEQAQDYSGVATRIEFETGEEVRVTTGAFANFTGVIMEVKPEKQKLKVEVSIFGRPTPVELNFTDVEKR